MNLSLTGTLEQYIKDKVDAGLYNNASEFVREAVRLKMQADANYEAKLEALRNDINLACKQIENGQYSTWDKDSFIASLDESTKKW